MHMYYYLDINHLNIKGVRNKIIGQIDGMKNNGIDVTLVINYKDPGFSDEFELTTGVRTVYMERSPRNLLFTGYLKDLVNLLRFTVSLDKRDILYARYNPMHIYAIPRNCIIITEHQTKELIEYKMSNKLTWLSEKCFGRINRMLRDYYVAVTNDISDYESTYGDVDHIVVTNGISLEIFPNISKKEILNNEFHIMGLANVSRWHGYDRIIEGLKDYSGSLNVYFHVIGEGEELPNLKRLASEYKLEEKVIFHGYKKGAELDQLMNTGHIAVGPIGLHRIQLTEGSTLKCREFCARGIPFVISSKDDDFLTFLYRCQIEPDESPANIDELIKFFEKCALDNYPKIMRDYAEQNLSWNQKMKTFYDFLKRISNVPYE